MDSCFACRERPRSRGLLCDACCVDVDDLCPEQFTARVALPTTPGANAFLFDGFGTPHVVSVSMPITSATIGRARTSDICIAERTVSQHHATLEYRPLSNAWYVVDGGSDNGTFVNTDRVARKFPLEPRDKIFLGRRIGFVFVPLDESQLDEATRELRWLRALVSTEPTVGDAGVDETTPLKIVAVTEGGAIATYAGERVQLSELEYELIVVLHQRFSDERDVDPAARGFVPAQQLLEKLSFTSEAPTHANLRGLVRKLRKKLADIDVVESRQGLGYRLARAISVA
jgi:pSer/pThr/pTyr-binding forkhead associated (FHA) protein